MASKLRQVLSESANAKAVRSLLIGLAAVVVLSVSGYGTVIYIQLMGKVFPDGPLLMACYMGAAANLLLMLVLLVGKFVWFRPGAHEVASWIVTGVELLVVVLNMMLAFELAGGQHLSSLMQAWDYLAPVSPIFSMVGATVLIVTSSELRGRHRQLELQEHKDQAEREFELAMHQAEMEDHAAMLVSEVLSGISGVQSVPRLRRARKVVEAQPQEEMSLEDDGWLSQVNARIEREREQRLAREAAYRDAQEEGGESAKKN